MHIYSDFHQLVDLDNSVHPYKLMPPVFRCEVKRFMFTSYDLKLIFIELSLER